MKPYKTSILNTRYKIEIEFDKDSPIDGDLIIAHFFCPFCSQISGNVFHKDRKNAIMYKCDDYTNEVPRMWCPKCKSIFNVNNGDVWLYDKGLIEKVIEENLKNK